MDQVRCYYSIIVAYSKCYAQDNIKYCSANIETQLLFLCKPDLCKKNRFDLRITQKFTDRIEQTLVVLNFANLFSSSEYQGNQ